MFKQAPPGRRFLGLYERQQQRRGPWFRTLASFSSIFAFAMAIVLLVIPWASIPCFILAALLLPIEWRSFARAYDRLELALRGRRRPSEPPRRDTGAQQSATALAAEFLDRINRAQQPPIVQLEVEPRGVWIRPAAAPGARVAGTTKVWSADIPVTPIRQRAASEPPPVRPSRAVIVVPPPVTITTRAENAKAPARRKTVLLHRRPET